MEERREVHCLSASLSEQDFESVGGASGREGFRRTMPRFEKYERPGSCGSECIFLRGVDRIEVSSEGGLVTGGSSHGVGSS